MSSTLQFSAGRQVPPLRRILVLLIAGGALAWLGAPPVVGQADDGPLPLVRVAEVKARSQAATVWVPGTLLSRHDTRVAAEVTGRIDRVAEVGERISLGGIIAQLDDKALKLELKAEEAEVGRLEARLHFVTKQLDRTQALADQHITSRRALDEFAAERAMAEQELEAARIETERTRHLIDRSIVRAPFAGVLVERLAEPGSHVTLGEDVARLVDIENVEIQALAPLSIAAFVRDGATVSVRGGGQTRDGQVRAAIPVGDRRSRSFEVRVTLADSPWPVGSALEVALPKEAPRDSKAEVAVPRDAMVLRQDATWVWLVEDEKVRRVDVELGEGSGDWIEARTDILKPGDRVVIRGGERLTAGQEIRIIKD